MSKATKKQGETVNSKKKLLDALLPLKKAKIANDLIAKLKDPETKMPVGKKASTEKFILGLSISFSLFNRNKSLLLKHGQPLKDYTLEYAKKIPLTDAPLVQQKMNELIKKNKTR